MKAPKVNGCHQFQQSKYRLPAKIGLWPSYGYCICKGVIFGKWILSRAVNAITNFHQPPNLYPSHKILVTDTKFASPIRSHDAVIFG